MHPEESLLEGRLPGLVARCFVEQRRGEATVLHDLPTRLDSVRLFPSSKRAVLVYRGVLPVDEDDADDVGLLLVACEKKGEPRSREHYEDAIARRKDPKRGHLHALRQRDLLPALAAKKSAEPDASGLEDLLRPERLAERNLSERMRRETAELRALVADKGGDPGALEIGEWAKLGAEDPDPEDMAELADKLDEERDRQQARAKDELAAAEARNRERYEAAGLDYDASASKAKAAETGPPKFSAEAEIERLQGVQQMAKNGGVDTPDLDAALADPGLEEKLRKAEAELKDQYRRTAHLRDVAAPRLEDPAREESWAEAGPGVDSSGRGAPREEAMRQAKDDHGGLEFERCVGVEGLEALVDLRGAELDEARPSLEEGIVLELRGEALTLRASGGPLEARRAAGCLLAPETGDRVLVSRAGAQAHVIAVLVRARPEEPARIRVPGDLELSAEQGRIEIKAGEEISLESGRRVGVTAGEVSVRALLGRLVIDRMSLAGSRLRSEVERVKTVAQTCEEVFESVTARLGRSYRLVDDVEQVKAQRIHYASRSTLSLRGENTLVSADDVVKVDGQQIHVG